MILFVLLATLVIFPAFRPPTDEFKKTYLPPPSAPPPPPSSSQTVPVPTQPVTTPTTAITSPNPTASFTVPMPVISPVTTPVDVTNKMTQQIQTSSQSISDARLSKIMGTEMGWGRDKGNILDSDSDPRNVVAKFPVYLASYANGDWDCNVRIEDGKIDAGSLPNLVAKLNEWSHGQITGEVVPTPLDIGGPDLLAKAPPFIFFTGHKDFVLTDQEIQNLRDYLQVGGAIWGDNALAGSGSRFDVAFHREMKRVIPDIDKNFEEVPLTSECYTKSWYPITKVPEGMNYYAEPLQHLDIDGKLAIIYTPNDYSDMFTMRILPGDTQMFVSDEYVPPPTLYTFTLNPRPFLANNLIYFRNYNLQSCLACQKLGMNIIGYLLVRFDKDLMLTP